MTACKLDLGKKHEWKKTQCCTGSKQQLSCVQKLVYKGVVGFLVTQTQIHLQQTAMQTFKVQRVIMCRLAQSHATQTNTREIFFFHAVGQADIKCAAEPKLQTLVYTLYIVSKCGYYIHPQKQNILHGITQPKSQATDAWLHNYTVKD